MASVTDLNYKVHTDKTSGINQLNSSKHPQQPDYAKPLNIFPIV